MHCPNCTATVPDGSVFCSACGTRITAGDTAAASAPVPPPPPPTATYQQPAPPAAAYQQPVPPGGAYQQPAPAQPVKKSNKGLVIAIVVIVALVLLGCCIGSVFAARALWDEGVTSIEDITDIGPGDDSGYDSGYDSGTDDDAATSGYSTPEEAVEAVLADSGYGDWVYDLYDDSGTIKSYWAGPPSSEYVYVITVTQADDGSWVYWETAPIDEGSGAASADGDAAQQVVLDYLWAVYEDRGLDAQSYCVEPFVYDSASAQVSAGGLSDFGIVSCTGNGDGTFWVRSYEIWYDEYVEWDYLVVPTEAGFAISDLAPVE